MDRGDWLSVVLFLHVLGAIAGVGPPLTYGVWIVRTERLRPEATAWILLTVRWVDRHLATPALLAQAVTGGLLVWLGRWDFFRTAWLLLGAGIYVAVVVAAVALVGPLSRRRLQLAERAPYDPGAKEEYGAVSRRLRPILAVVSVATLSIVYLMVGKPALWSG